MRAIESLKICTLMGSFCPRLYAFNEKLQKSYVSWHWRVMQSLKKNWLLVPKMTWGIWWIFMRAMTSLKRFWSDKSEKGHALFKEKLTGGLKNDIRNLINFHARSHKFENLHFDGLVFSKAYKVLDEKVQNSYVSWQWTVIQRKANSWEICIFVGCNRLEAASGR